MIAAKRCTSARTTPRRGGSRKVVNQPSGGARPAERSQRRARSTASASGGRRSGTGWPLRVPQTPAQQRPTDHGL